MENNSINMENPRDGCCLGTSTVVVLLAHALLGTDAAAGDTLLAVWVAGHGCPRIVRVGGGSGSTVGQSSCMLKKLSCTWQ